MSTSEPANEPYPDPRNTATPLLAQDDPSIQAALHNAGMTTPEPGQTSAEVAEGQAAEGETGSSEIPEGATVQAVKDYLDAATDDDDRARRATVAADFESSRDGGERQGVLDAIDRARSAET